MAVLLNNARFLLRLRAAGADFGRTLTLGRMSWLVGLRHAADLRRAIARAGLNGPAADAVLALRPGEFADPFFRLLGCHTLDSVDYSGYEGATLVHDLNRPVPDEWAGRYDLVFDGGCLEHVFNYPAALASCLRLTRVGGRVVLHTPCNNAAGHGFYQFSPELFFRVFAPANGYNLESLFAHENFRGVEGTAWYEVQDPAVVGRRVGLDAGHPIMLLVSGLRTAAVEPFQTPPLQSDYQPAWAAGRSPVAAVGGGWLTRLEAHLPRLFGVLRTARNPLRNRRFFRPAADA